MAEQFKTWGKFQVGGNANARPIIVDGAVYFCSKEAAELYDISLTAARNRVKNPRFPSWVELGG